MHWTTNEYTNEELQEIVDAFDEIAETLQSKGRIALLDAVPGFSEMGAFVEDCQRRIVERTGKPPCDRCGGTKLVPYNGMIANCPQCG